MFQKKIKTSDFLFFSSYIIYLFFSILSYSFYYKYFNNYYKYIIALCIVLLVIKEIQKKKIRVNDIFFLAICTTMTVIMFFSIDSKVTLLPLFLYIYCARNVDFIKIAKISMYIDIFCLVLISISGLLGIILNPVTYYQERMRMYLGFRYVLYPSSLLLNIITLNIFIHKDNFSIIRFIVLNVVNFIMFEITDSRLVFTVGIGMLLFALFYKYKPNFLEKRKILSNVLSFLFIICCILGFIIGYYYDKNNEIMFETNKTLEGRIGFSNQALKDYGVSLLGIETNYNGNGLDVNGNKSTDSYYYVDCFYINIAQRYGMIFLTLFMILATYFCKKLNKNKEYMLLIIFAITALRSLIDDLVVYLTFNTFWLTMGNFVKIKETNEEINSNKKEENYNE